MKSCNNFVLSFFVSLLKTKFSIKDFFSKCDHVRSFLRIWSHLLKKSLTENFFFFFFFTVNATQHQVEI